MRRPLPATVPTHRPWRHGRVLIASIVFFLCFWASPSYAVPQASSGMVLRIRMEDGSMEKLQIQPGSEKDTTLGQVLTSAAVKKGAKIEIGGKEIAAESLDSSIADLGLKHGALVTVRPALVKPSASRFSTSKHQQGAEWQPFPDLAKNYDEAVLRTRTRKFSQQGMSYGDIANLQSSLHIVDPQPEAALKRVYMCRTSAERFQTNGLDKKSNKATPRVGLLLGTIQRERVETKPRKARTSLSSQPTDADYCTVAKVHAIWEPRNQKGDKVYEVEKAQSLLSSNPRILELADQLGLIPIGWIFSYVENRHEDDDALPVLGVDVQTGATLQIENMKRHLPDASDGAKFATLAMDAQSGATEAFQLSDVSVQMVSEGLLVLDSKLETPSRHVETRNAILVDGRETTSLDSVLCLVNTAMLSHQGTFGGKNPTSAIKKNGSLTAKTKKALSKAMGDDAKLLEELCDFQILLALDERCLSNKEAEELCQIVKKWSRGQKQGTELSSSIKKKLSVLLET